MVTINLNEMSFRYQKSRPVKFHKEHPFKTNLLALLMKQVKDSKKEDR